MSKKTYSMKELDKLIDMAIEQGIDLSKIGTITVENLEKLVKVKQDKPN